MAPILSEPQRVVCGEVIYEEVIYECMFILIKNFLRYIYNEEENIPHRGWVGHWKAG